MAKPKSKASKRQSKQAGSLREAAIGQDSCPQEPYPYRDGGVTVSCEDYTSLCNQADLGQRITDLAEQTDRNENHIAFLKHQLAQAESLQTYLRYQQNALQAKHGL